MVNLKAIFRGSFISRIFKSKWKRFKSFLAIGLCFSFLTVTSIALLSNELVKSEPTAFKQDNLIDLELPDELESENSDKPLRFYNTTISSIFFVMPLYSKLNSSDIFGNNIRGNILNLITDHPGITLGAITRKQKLKNGTATHHLRILEREGYIKSKKTGKFRRYYIIGTKATGFNEIQDQIVSIIKERPGISQSDIGRELHLSRQLVNYHLKDLIHSEVIQIEKNGNKSFCYPNN